MERKIPYKSISRHSLDDLKNYHSEATKFFASQLMILKDVIPKISDERQGKAATLLISCTQTGAALLQLANQTDSFTTESIMLSRAFMEKITNFVYASICDVKEYRAFILHPIYKQYCIIGAIEEDDVELDKNSKFEKDKFLRKDKARKEKQAIFRELPIVLEALEIFSLKRRGMNKKVKKEWINKTIDQRIEEIEKWSNLPWTDKSMDKRIEVIEKWGKCLDVFFKLSKLQYYSDASEALHGSLYGCTYGVGSFDPQFESTKKDELEKKLYKDSACNLISLGCLIHESFTVIKYNNDIEELWGHSYNNRGMALNLHFHILERKIK